MPTRQPQISFQQLRNLTEQWQWRDSTGATRTGFNPPADAKDKRQKPYYVRYVTSKGIVEEGEVITLKVFPRLHQRMIRFNSGQVRRIRDYLIIEVDGMRVVTH